MLIIWLTGYSGLLWVLFSIWGKHTNTHKNIYDPEEREERREWRKERRVTQRNSERGRERNRRRLERERESRREGDKEKKRVRLWEMEAENARNVKTPFVANPTRTHPLHSGESAHCTNKRPFIVPRVGSWWAALTLQSPAGRHCTWSVGTVEWDTADYVSVKQQATEYHNFPALGYFCAHLAPWQVTLTDQREFGCIYLSAACTMLARNTMCRIPLCVRF